MTVGDQTHAREQGIQDVPWVADRELRHPGDSLVVPEAGSTEASSLFSTLVVSPRPACNTDGAVERLGNGIRDVDVRLRALMQPPGFMTDRVLRK